MDLTRLSLVLARELGVLDPEPVERDIRLHLLLSSIVEMPSASELIFKGGTCLAKCYLNYHRFSADLDFTWKNQAAWATGSGKAAREELRRAQRPLEAQMQAAAMELGMEFRAPEHARFGLSNRMMTMMVHYQGIAGTPSVIKVQVSFEDVLLRAPRRRQAANAFGGSLPTAARIADSTTVARYERPVSVVAMDPAEIVAEKVRAILTRQAAKGRDLVDLFLLQSDLGLSAFELKAEAKAKTRFALDMAARYRQHIGRLDERLEAMASEDLEPMLLRPVAAKKLAAYRERLVPLLTELAAELQAPLDKAEPPVRGAVRPR